MKNKFFVMGMIFITGVLFCSSSPSLDGRAVVADPGTFPQGYFAKTVGYLPGDNINVTNPANGKQVDILVIGSLDPSEGVAILLSPEAASSLDVKKDSNNLVRLTKRTGQLDEAANGIAVLDDSTPAVASAPVEKAASAGKSAEERNIVPEEKNDVETIPAETAGTGERETLVAAAAEPVSDPVIEDVITAENIPDKENVPVAASAVEAAEPAAKESAPAAESFIAESHPAGYVGTAPETNVPASPVEEAFVADGMPDYVAAVPVVPVPDEADDEPLEAESFSDDVVIPAEESFVAENIPDEKKNPVSRTEKVTDAVDPVKGTTMPLAESFVAEDIPESTADTGSTVPFVPSPVVGESSVEPETEGFDDDGIVPYEETVTVTSESEEEAYETVPAVVLVPVTASEPVVETEKTAENKTEKDVVVVNPAPVEGRKAVVEEESYDAIVLIPTDERPPVSAPSDDVPVLNEIPVDDVPPENIALEIIPVEVAERNPVPSENVVVETDSASVVVEESVIANDYESKEKIRFVSSFNALEKKRYYVQIAVYGKTDNVKNVSDNYGTKYPLVCVSERNGTKNSVLVGPLNVDEYGTVLERFRAYGFKDAYLRFFK